MSLPLENIKIVITRSESQSLNDILEFEKLGAKVLNFPTIIISKLDDYCEADKILKNVNDFDYLIFTSSNSVKYFFQRISELQIQINFEKVKIISIGKGTEKLLIDSKIKIDFIPTKFSANDLLSEISVLEIANKNILIPGSSIMRNELYDGLINHNANVTKCEVYQNIIPKKSEININELENFNADLFVFTSPSTFNNFLEILEIENPKSYFAEKTIAVIGPTTKQTLIDKGIEPNIFPQNYDMKNLIEEIKYYYKN
ncbi:MAG: uroporphyrinogen-III synthase [Ignavibacteriae bacterium]|nr:uroporphyrinogen-III synthase [Ignavibacteriota bacterium]